MSQLGHPFQNLPLGLIHFLGSLLWGGFLGWGFFRRRILGHGGFLRNGWFLSRSSFFHGRNFLGCRGFLYYGNFLCGRGFFCGGCFLGGGCFLCCGSLLHRSIPGRSLRIFYVFNCLYGLFLNIGVGGHLSLCLIYWCALNLGIVLRVHHFAIRFMIRLFTFIKMQT